MPVETPIPFSEADLANVTYNSRMLAWMNDASLRQTLETGRQEYWCKGETSDDRRYVRSAAYDCDGDTPLFSVEQEGAGACHTGNYLCFFRAFSDAAD
jgi:phosphoribosyl-AMP cyclohydrolase